MKCPICHQETTWQNNPTRPFCSERCQMQDLGKWAQGDYRIDGGPKTHSEETSGHETTDPREDSEHIN